MSVEQVVLRCASCGNAEGVVQLKECDGCDLVRYCSDACQRDHKPEHEEVCKKRAAELRDELLFKQPECSHVGDCPICMLPLPLDMKKSSMCCSCSKVICKGCNHANNKRVSEQRLQQSCLFCREPVAKTEEEHLRRNMKRVEVNDPVALCHEGVAQEKKGDYSKAFEYYTKAAELGDAEAHCKLARLYHFGQGVEKDWEKVIYHWEEAAIGGHPLCRFNLGSIESLNGNAARAVKHWIIAANLGQDESIKELMRAFKRGECSNDELASALRAHKAAVDETKSPQRAAAAKAWPQRESAAKFWRIKCKVCK